MAAEGLPSRAPDKDGGNGLVSRLSEDMDGPIHVAPESTKAGKFPPVKSALTNASAPAAPPHAKEADGPRLSCNSNASLRAPTMAMQRMHWITSPNVWYRHPAARLFVAWGILVQDFYIYGEDPVNDSHVPANFPGMGQAMGLITLHSADTVALGFLRLSLVIFALIVAHISARIVLVKCLRERLSLNLFAGPEGALLVFFFVLPIWLVIFAEIYNVLIPDWAKPLDGTSLHLCQVFGAKSRQFRHINQTFQVLSGVIDFLAIMAVTDQVLQDRAYWPEFLPQVKRLWAGRGGMNRVIVFWSVIGLALIVVAICVYCTGKDDEDIRWRDRVIGGQTENARSFLASMIIFSDLFTTMQDWAFPIFTDPLDLEVPTLVPGWISPTIGCGCFGSLARMLPSFPSFPLHTPRWLSKILPSRDDLGHLTVNGKWLTYGPLLGVMCVDLLCTRTQIIYNPPMFGQYVDPKDDRIWTIIDEEYLNAAWNNTNWMVFPEMITYKARRNETTGEALPNTSADTDVKLNSRYINAEATKYVPVVLSIVWIVGFLASAVWGNRLVFRQLQVAAAEGSPVTLRKQQSRLPSGEAQADQQAAPAGGGAVGAPQGREPSLETAKTAEVSMLTVVSSSSAKVHTKRRSEAAVALEKRKSMRNNTNAESDIAGKVDESEVHVVEAPAPESAMKDEGAEQTEKEERTPSETSLEPKSEAKSSAGKKKKARIKDKDAGKKIQAATAKTIAS